MNLNDTDIAWLAGIIDGEGCFSIKRPIVRKSGERVGYKTCYQVWLVVCNTSEPMIERVRSILEAAGIKHQPIRKVWKGDKATRWQWWIHIAKKRELLRATELLLPHLTAKKVEAEVVAWFLRRACKKSVYRTTHLDRAVLDALSLVKRNGGEAPAEVAELLRAVIPSQAVSGDRMPSDQETEGVETRSVSPNNNPTHECPAPLRLISRKR
jgi:hypothetical protein